MPNITQEINHYANKWVGHYQMLLSAFIAMIFFMLTIVGFLLYQVHHRPVPVFNAVAPNGQVMRLTPHNEPNLLPNTLLQWAAKAAVAAYTFDFVNYTKQAELVRSYFTDAGWKDYVSSLGGLIQTITKNQLLVNAVVSGTPVISNQGELGRGGQYAWRIQIPFLVTYQSADSTSKKSYTVTLTIVKVPPSNNPSMIGIDQFVMG